MPLGARTAVVTISIIVPTVRRMQRKGAKQEGREVSRILISKAVLLGLFAFTLLGLVKVGYS